jgi:hypothetical protein
MISKIRTPFGVSTEMAKLSETWRHVFLDERIKKEIKYRYR